MSNLFDQAANRLKGSPVVVWIFFASLISFLGGLVLFAEDTYSSYAGIQELERVFHITPANHPFSYLVMSVIPQVGQVMALYFYALDRKKNKWALALFLLLFAADYTADLQERSNGQFLADGIVHLTPAVLVAAGMTTGYFTIGSEIFITLGIGLVLATFNDAMDQALLIYVKAKKTWYKAKMDISEANAKLEDFMKRYQNKSQSPS